MQVNLDARCHFLVYKVGLQWSWHFPMFPPRAHIASFFPLPPEQAATRFCSFSFRKQQIAFHMFASTIAFLDFFFFSVLALWTSLVFDVFSDLFLPFLHVSEAIIFLFFGLVPVLVFAFGSCCSFSLFLGDVFVRSFRISCQPAFRTRSHSLALSHSSLFSPLSRRHIRLPIALPQAQVARVILLKHMSLLPLTAVLLKHKKLLPLSPLRCFLARLAALVKTLRGERVTDPPMPLIIRLLVSSLTSSVVSRISHLASCNCFFFLSLFSF